MPVFQCICEDNVCVYVVHVYVLAMFERALSQRIMISDLVLVLQMMWIILF